MVENGTSICQFTAPELDEEVRNRLSDALLTAIARLEAVVTQETTLLRENRAINLQDFNQRKTQGLLELRRAISGFQQLTTTKEIQLRFAHLYELLDGNLIALQHHLKAIEAVTETIIETVQQAESDGTYSAIGIIDRQVKC